MNVECIVTTLATLGGIALIYRAYRFVFVDRIPKEEVEHLNVSLERSSEAIKSWQRMWDDRGRAMDRMESRYKEDLEWVPVSRDAPIHAGDEYRIFLVDNWLPAYENSMVGQSADQINQSFPRIAEVRRKRSKV